MEEDQGENEGRTDNIETEINEQEDGEEERKDQERKVTKRWRLLERQNKQDNKEEE